MCCFSVTFRNASGKIYTGRLTAQLTFWYLSVQKSLSIQNLITCTEDSELWKPNLNLKEFTP